jgi:hypothetical protein
VLPGLLAQMTNKIDPTSGTGLLCYYCQIFDSKKSPANVTLHDKRGCFHVCMKHAKWRFTTSWMFGHSLNCPFKSVE